MTYKKEEFLRKFNDAFLKPDIPFILDSVTDDVEWEMVGDQTFHGKEELQKFFDNMDDSSKLLSTTIDAIITHGRKASVNGRMTMENKGAEEHYGFCDVYEFSGFKDPKIKKLTSYIVILKS